LRHFSAFIPLRHPWFALSVGIDMWRWNVYSCVFKILLNFHLLPPYRSQNKKKKKTYNLTCTRTNLKCVQNLPQFPKSSTVPFPCQSTEANYLCSEHSKMGIKKPFFFSLGSRMWGTQKFAPFQIIAPSLLHLSNSQSYSTIKGVSNTFKIWLLWRVWVR
jgi:hypothetical protein